MRKIGRNPPTWSAGTERANRPPPMVGTIFQIQHFAINKGPGIRVAVLLKGCPLRCWWCHSPEGQQPQEERLSRCATCEDDSVEPCKTAAADIVGRQVTVKQLLAEIDRDRAFVDRSRGGVTFTGGEPLMQPRFLAEALDACRVAGFHTALETSGYAPWPTMEIALRADLVFFDLKLADEQRHKEVTGVSNRRILDNFRRLVRIHPAVRPRIPLVPGINDDEANLDALGHFVSWCGLRHVELVPYHTDGIAKYAQLGRPYTLAPVEPPTPEAIAAAASRLTQFRLFVAVGE